MTFLPVRTCIYSASVGRFSARVFRATKEKNGGGSKAERGIWVDFKVLTYIYIVQTNELTPNEAVPRNGDRDASTRMPGKAGCLLALGIADMRQR